MVVLTSAILAALALVLVANLIYLRRGPSPAPAPVAESAPLISILVPARNEEAQIGDLLQSLAIQNYPNYEVLVFDDASEDGTGAVVREAARTAEEHGYRLSYLRGDGPPEGWLGKSYALDRAAREAEGSHLLFLDADVRLRDADALGRIAETVRGWGSDRVLSGFPRLVGGGRLLTSLVPFTVLTMLPWPLVEATDRPALSSLNGQCWMIEAETYRRHRPHRAVRGTALEDVAIGRHLKARGVMPRMVDLTGELDVRMYETLSEAWRGFRKNAYLLAGGTAWSAVLTALCFAVVFLAAPLLNPRLIPVVWGLKLVTDQRARQAERVTLGAPISFVLAVFVLLDSTAAYLLGRVEWKGRNVIERSDRTA